MRFQGEVLLSPTLVWVIMLKSSETLTRRGRETSSDARGPLTSGGFEYLCSVAVSNQFVKIISALDSYPPVASLRPSCDRLIIDLRGNLGGFVGALRLMSYLTPDRVPVGYSLTRNGRARSLRPQQLPALDRLPESTFDKLTQTRSARSMDDGQLMTEGQDLEVEGRA
jgi:hypothetical protein